MRIINSAIVRVPAALVLQGGGRRPVDVSIRYGLISGDAPALVDTGYGPRVTEGERSRALRLYAALLRPKLVASGQPDAVLAQAGLARSEIKTIVVTHLHADHVAGLRDVPQARILACRDAIAAAATLAPRQAMRHGIFLDLLPPDFASRAIAIQSFPLRDTGTVLGGGYDLFRDGSYLAVPLPGHAIGHFGLFWRTPDGPALYATDVAWTMRALLGDRTPAISRAFVFEDRRIGRTTEAKVRAFHEAGGAVHLAHDVTDWP